MKGDPQSHFSFPPIGLLVSPSSYILSSYVTYYLLTVDHHLDSNLSYVHAGALI